MNLRELHLKRLHFLSRRPAPVRYCLFDAYGTLVELDDFYGRLQSGFARRGCHIPKEDIMHAAHCEMRHYIGNSIGARDEHSWGALRIECARVLSESLAVRGHAVSLAVDDVLHVLSNAIVFRVFPEVTEVLNALRQRFVGMAVMSNWDYQIPSVLHGMDLSKYFDFILSSSMIGAEKPSPNFFQAGLDWARRLHPDLDPAQCVYVGDHYEKDVVGSRLAGFKPLWLVRDQRDLTSGESPTKRDVPLLASLRDLLHYVEQQ